MRKRVSLFLCALLVAALVLPLAAEAAAPTGFVPEPVTEKEAAYTHVGLYEVPCMEENEATPESAATVPEEEQAGLFAAGSFNTENAKTVYNFLMEQMGLNIAQSAGIMASMYTESQFDPTAYNGSDTGGTVSYGLCQWNSWEYNGYSRLGGLRDWCSANGYDYTTVDGQLRFLQYEVGSTEKSAWNKMQGIENTADGAYIAGYNWARYFERGAKAYWDSRAALARDDFWSICTQYEAERTAKPDPTLARQFVTRLYKTCLDRDPETAGLEDWTNRLAAGTLTGTQAASGIVFSEEFKNFNFCNTDYVKHLYRGFMDREADAAGLAYWENQLATGFTRENVFNGFAMSDEFKALCAGYGIRQGTAINEPIYGTVPHGACPVDGKMDGVTAFVTRMYQVALGRAPEADGLHYWTGRLWNHTASGRELGAGFIFSAEFKSKNYSDSEYVKYLYTAFLDRNADAAGLADWVSRLAAGASREVVFDGFAGSAEFKNICSSYGIVQG